MENSNNPFKFNRKEMAYHVIERLSSRTRGRPFPHIRVLGPNPYTQSKSLLFTPFTSVAPHLMGAKVAIKPPTQLNSTCTTHFDFYLRKDARKDARLPLKDQAFYHFILNCTIEFASWIAHLKVMDEDSKVYFDEYREMKQEGQERVVDFQWFFEYDFTYSVKKKVNGKPAIKLEVEPQVGDKGFLLDISKRVIPSDDEWAIEFKVRNQSKQSRKFTHYERTDLPPMGVIDLPEPNPEDEALPLRDYVYSVSAEESSSTSLEEEQGVYYSVNDFRDEQIRTNYCLECTLKEVLLQCEWSKLPAYKTPVRRVFNSLPVEISDTAISFSDYYVGEEFIYRIKYAERGLVQFARELAKHGLRLDPMFCNIFAQKFQTSPEDVRLYEYQEEAVEEMLREIKERAGKILLISVRTAGGKTEAFLIGILQFCLGNLDKKGTKAIIFYPTKALANDQAKRVFEALYYINQELHEQGHREITVAIYHGDTPQAKHEEPKWIPFKCPKCQSTLIRVQSSSKESKELQCEECGISFPFVYMTREECHRNPPDILITNPDTITYILSTDASRQVLFGRPIKICPECGKTFANLRKQVCSNQECGARLEDVQPDCGPEIIVYDEIHIFNGAFGMNVAFFNRRLKSLIERIYNRFFNREYQPIYVGSSATIKNAKRFGARFFDREEKDVILIPSSQQDIRDLTSLPFIRQSIFLLPRAYRVRQTASFAIAIMLRSAYQAGFNPRILCFVNNLKDCNDLIRQTRIRSQDTGFKIDGHNTQYDASQRVEREIAFNKGELQVLFATPTLEVGVDFDAIHGLVVFGPPFLPNNYLQRIGRAGRQSDALVITICRSNQAIDYYYFENASEIIKNPNAFVSNIPLGENNPIIISKALHLAFFDWLMLIDNPDALYEGEKMKQLTLDRSDWKSEVKQEIKDYWNSVIPLATTPQQEEVLESLRFEMNKSPVGEGARLSAFERVYQRLNREKGIFGLRSSDTNVEVNYIFGR